MKKAFLTSFILCHLFFDNGFFKLSFNSDKGSALNMSSQKGKVTAFCFSDPASVDYPQLKVLDSFSKLTNLNLTLIVIPRLDSQASFNAVDYSRVLRDSISANLIISVPGFAAKNTGSNQHPVIKWLQNHTGAFFASPDLVGGDVVLVNGSGQAYAILRGEKIPRHLRRAIVSAKD